MCERKVVELPKEVDQPYFISPRFFASLPLQLGNMFKFLFYLFIFYVVYRYVFGGFKIKVYHYNQTPPQPEQRQQQNHSHNQGSVTIDPKVAQARKKNNNDQLGEYVDFEEVK